MNPPLSRRAFLTTAAAGTALAVTPTHLLRAADKSPNEKLNLAFIGVANKGWHNIEHLRSQNVVALCDVDGRYLDRAAAAFPKATRYRDYRKMFDAEANRIDAVVVSTPDHTHAGPTAIALSLGKHVYCEKPLAHTVREARTLAELAKKHKCVTQMGTQIHAGDNYRRVVEIIQSGALGTVREVYNWRNQGRSGGRFLPPEPVPAYLEWDLWLGPAEQRPYAPKIHPGDWRRFWEYGSGTFGDMACHVMDLPFWALGLRYPTSVEAEGPEVHLDGAPPWVKVRYDFAARGEQPALAFYWSDGGAHHDPVKSTKDYTGRPLSAWNLGVLFVGDKGLLAADYNRHQLYPREQFAGFEPPPRTIPASIGHWNEWVEACKSGGPTTCPFDYSGALTETVLLGVVAYRVGKKLAWDPKGLKATNCPAAEEFLTKEYRKGWEVVGMS